MIVFFFYNHAPTKLYTLSLHDALPISRHKARAVDQLYRNEPLAIYTPRVLRLVLNPQFSTDARSPEIGDSTIRLDRRERIISYSDDRQSRSTEEGTLASVRLTDYPDLHLTPQNTFSSSIAHQ